jgi:hypothetical protein
MIAASSQHSFAPTTLAANVTNRLCKISDIVELLEALEAAQC